MRDVIIDGAHQGRANKTEDHPVGVDGTNAAEYEPRDIFVKEKIWGDHPGGKDKTAEGEDDKPKSRRDKEAANGLIGFIRFECHHDSTFLKFHTGFKKRATYFSIF